MRKILFAIVAVAMMACDKHAGNESEADIVPVDTMQTMEIHFTFGGYSMEPMTRSTLTEAGLTDLWLFDYLDGSLVSTIHQSSTDEGFGSVSLSADYGDHTFYFVASNSVDPVIDGTFISWTRIKEVFWKSLSLTVAPGMTTSQDVSLQRVCTRLRVSVTDEVPSGLASLTLTPTHWYYGMDYTTSSPTDDRNTPRTINVPASYAGTTGNLATSIYSLCGTEGFSTNVQLTANGTDESTLASISLEDVPFKRNRITAYSGSLFSSTRTMTISVDDGWDEDYEVTW